MNERVPELFHGADTLFGGHLGYFFRVMINSCANYTSNSNKMPSLSVPKQSGQTACERRTDLLTLSAIRLSFVAFFLGTASRFRSGTKTAVILRGESTATLPTMIANGFSRWDPDSSMLGKKIHGLENSSNPKGLACVMLLRESSVRRSVFWKPNHLRIHGKDDLSPNAVREMRRDNGGDSIGRTD